MTDIEKRLGDIEAALLEMSSELSDLRNNEFGRHAVPKEVRENPRIAPKDPKFLKEWCVNWAEMRQFEDAYRLIPVLQTEWVENFLRDLIQSEIGMAQFDEDRRFYDKFGKHRSDLEDSIVTLVRKRQDEAKRRIEEDELDIIEEWGKISPEQEAKTAKTIAEVEAKINKYFEGNYAAKPTILERIGKAKSLIEEGDILTEPPPYDEYMDRKEECESFD